MSPRRAKPLLLLLAALCSSAAPAPQPSAIELFENKIRPVLVEHCYECHSAAGKQKGGLLLDNPEGWLRGGDSGPAILPGKPTESLLLKAIAYEDPDLQMPPKKGPLPASVVADFERWIAAGAAAPAEAVPHAPAHLDIAEARTRWPFVPPAKPHPPAVKNQGWVRTEVDRFILAKIEEANLTPAPPAEKRVLLRRATFDLTGLPPTAEETAAFLADGSEEAFAKVIERLLASPAYGERWGRHWLDVVRYTDSFDSRGIRQEGDVREAYRYRDWVVRSFNEDLPYDEFVRQQIAGDILATKPNGSFDTNALIATGVYVFGEWGLGDSDKEKMLTDIVDDQIDLTGRAFLGLTLACARCHDHKFDPVTTRDYYAMAGIFFSSHILPNPGLKTAGSPTKRVPLASPAQIKEREAKLERAEALAKERDQRLDEFIRGRAASIVTNFADLLIPAEAKPIAGFFPPQLRSGIIDYLGLGGGRLLSTKAGKVAGHESVYSWRLPEGADTPSATINTGTEAVTIGTLTLPPRSVSIHPSPNRGVTVQWQAAATHALRVRAAIQDADDKCGDGVTWSVTHAREGGVATLYTNAIPNGGKDAAPELEVSAAAGDYLAFTVYSKGAYECDTTAISIALEDSEGRLSWDLAQDVLGSPSANPLTPGRGGEWSFRQAAPLPATGSSLAKLARAPTPEAQRGAALEIGATLAEVHRSGTTNDSPEGRLYSELMNPRSSVWSRLRVPSTAWEETPLAPLLESERKREELVKEASLPFPVTHALQEGGTPESAHTGFQDAKIHIRGRYDRLGETVPRGFPAVLAQEQPTITEGSGRLELARWVADARNPLTARVMVNRIWQHHFGDGLVRTPNNFGKLGAPPTHPELLDYLAEEFVRSGWSVKAMHRLLMSSAVYQQSSRAAPETLGADPENQLFARASRRRLESEAIRDSLLAVSGRLQHLPGGLASTELDHPRRTLYLITVRSDRATYQTLFDAADSSSIVEKRAESTVAPQALFFLNHPLVIDSAARLARLAEAASADQRKRVEWLYERLYARPPTERELQTAFAVSRDNSAEAWQRYCHALLCANEFVYLD